MNIKNADIDVDAKEKSKFFFGSRIRSDANA